jgi:hypothetical protein
MGQSKAGNQIIFTDDDDLRGEEWEDEDIAG